MSTAFASFFLAGSASADAMLDLCSNSKNIYRVVLFERHETLFGDVSDAHGWYDIDSGSCRSWIFSGNVQVFLSITVVDGMTRRVLDYGVDTLPEWFLNSASYGVERFFCVKDEKFLLNGEIIYAETCPEGYYLQLFNLFAFVENNSKFTLNLD